MAKKKVSQQKPAIKKKVEKKKRKKTSPARILMKVKATYNNTVVSATTPEGDVISWSSCGVMGFAGSKKSTTYAATKAGEDAATKAIAAGAKEAEVIVNGIGVGRQAAVKGIRAAGIRITSLSDRTPVPHGGCKPRKSPKK
jgi:small subunit ribosomal protein S11